MIGMRKVWLVVAAVSVVVAAAVAVAASVRLCCSCGRGCFYGWLLLML
jgi:hypothetical protein